MSELVKHHCQSGEAIRDKMVIYPLETPVAEYIADLQKQNAALQAKVDELEESHSFYESLPDAQKKKVDALIRKFKVFPLAED